MVYVPSMKTLLLSSLLALAPAVALAAGPVALGPDGGHYGHWTAAVYGQGSDKVCYAFTNAQSSKPATQGRSKVMLTVSERHTSRDEVSVNTGRVFPHDAKVDLTVGSAAFPLYTQNDMAFAADGKGTVAAFKIGNTATLAQSGPHGHGKRSAEFSLDGFSDAYEAIVHACP